MAGITLKDGFSDVALFISRGVGVMMGVTKACVSENIYGSLWQEKVPGSGLLFVRPCRCEGYHSRTQCEGQVRASQRAMSRGPLAVGFMDSEHKYKYIDGSYRLPIACIRMSSLTNQAFASLCSPPKDSLLQS